MHDVETGTRRQVLSPDFLGQLVRPHIGKIGVAVKAQRLQDLPRRSVQVIPVYWGLARDTDFLANHRGKTIHWPASVSIRPHVNAFGSLPAVIPFLIVVAKQIHR